MHDVKNVLIVADGHEDARVEAMFREEGWAITTDLSDADLVQFVGGADVNPELYNQHKHLTTYFDKERDEREAAIYIDALEQGIPMAGICRGGQFLNVMNGGSMYQDVDHHAIGGTHKAWLIGSGIPIYVTSTHHQMMYPNYSANFVLVMTAQESTKRYSMSRLEYGCYESVAYSPLAQPTDVECLFYRDSNCLCFQPHPEYHGSDVAETREVYFTLLDRYLFDNIEETLREEA